MPPEPESIITSYDMPAGVIVTTFLNNHNILLIIGVVKSNKVCTRGFLGGLWELLLVLSVPIAPISHSGWTVLEAPPIL